MPDKLKCLANIYMIVLEVEVSRKSRLAHVRIVKPARSKCMLGNIRETDSELKGAQTVRM